MVTGTTNTGEEYVADQLDGITVNVALLDETLANISETDTISTLTEPSPSEYARQSTTLSVSKQNGDYVLTNDNKLTFEVTGGTITVDSYAVLVQFTSDETGDTSASWHILQPAAFTESADLSAGIDIIEINAGTVGINIS